MSERLLKRKGVYYYRRRSPSDLTKVLGRQVIQQSLRTSNLGDAKRLRAVVDARWDDEFDRLRREIGIGAQVPAPVATSTVEVVRAYVSNQYSASEAQFYSAPATDEQLRDMQGEAASLLSQFANGQTGEAHEAIARVADDILPAPLNDDAEAALVVQRGLVELYRRRNVLFSGSTKGGFFDPMFDPEKTETTFRDVAEQYRKNRADDAASNGLRRKTADKINARIDLVIELVGDCSVQNCDYDRCMGVRTILAKWPANRNKLYPDLSTEDAIARAAQENRRTLSPITQAD